MALKLSIDDLQASSDSRKLNEEWLAVTNEGDAPFNADGCSITVARSESGRSRVVTTIKAGLIIKPGERVRLVTGSSGKRSHGAAPDDDRRNVHLFLKARYLDRDGLVIRVMNRQLELAKASYPAVEPEAPAEG